MLVRKSLDLLSTEDKSKGTLVLVLVIGMSLLEIVGVASVIPFLTVIGDPKALEQNVYLQTTFDFVSEFGVQSHQQFVYGLGIGSFLFIVFSSLYKGYVAFISNTYIENIRHSLSVRLLRVYASQAYPFYLQRNTGELSKNILSEVDLYVGNVFRPIFNMLAHGMILAGMIIILFILDPLLILFSFGILLFVYSLIYLLFKKKLLSMGKDRSLANTGRFNLAAEFFYNIKLIKSMNKEAFFFKKFDAFSNLFSASQARYHNYSQWPNYFIEALVFGAVILIVLYLMSPSADQSPRAISEILPLLGVYALSAYKMKPAAHHIYHGVSSLRYGESILNKLSDDLGLVNEEIILDKRLPHDLKFKKEIVVENLHFKYDESTDLTLKGLNLSIPKGHAIGLMGLSGSGKTTFVDVLLGLLIPSMGHVEVDGKKIDSNNRSCLGKMIGYIPQDIRLLDLSIAENIALGVDAKDINIDQLESVSKQAGIFNFIKAQTNGFDTLVGDHGVRLSGGQRQRIGIARALYHNPPVLIFDEGTSALDIVTENEVLTSLEKLIGERTIIFIAHKLGTLKHCNTIYCMNKGEISLSGNYEYLVNNSILLKELLS